jgi:hypothetical protein
MGNQNKIWHLKVQLITLIVFCILMYLMLKYTH